jgi:hypothetical protein
MIDVGCADYDGENRRKHCELVIVLKAQAEEEKKSRDAFREYVTESLKELKESIRPLDEINTSYTRGKWIIGIVVLAAVGSIVGMTFEWFKKHWN